MEELIIALLLIILGILIGSPNSSEYKIKYIDKKLDRIMKHLGIEEINIDEELKDFLAEGKKILAIKRLREETQMSLKESKEYVDNLEKQSKY